MLLLGAKFETSFGISLDPRLSWFTNHDIKLDGLIATCKVDLLLHFEAEFTVNNGVNTVAAFEVSGPVLGVGLNRQ